MESKTKNVLYVGPNYRHWKGGISSVILEYKNSFPFFNFFPSTSLSNIYVTTLSFPFLIMGFCIRLFISKHIEIIHIHGASQGSFYRKYIFFFISKYLFQKKVIYHIHGAKYHVFYNKSSRFIKSRIINLIDNADAVIVLSEWWKTFIESNFKPNKIQIIPNIVSAVQEKRNTENQQQQKPVLLFLGRIGERKGVYDLVDVVINNLSYFKPRCKLLIGGDGEVSELKRILKQNDALDVIEYIGFVSGKEKEKVLSNTDIYVLPSYNEGLPISILEAMAYGKPIISTKVGGIPEIVEHGFNGLLIEAGDKQSLLESIIWMIENTEERKSYGKASYQIVSKRYFPQPVLEKLEKLYSLI